MSSSDDIKIVVCIPTFRRPDGLAATLKSLAAQTIEDAFAILVVDNDAASQAGRVVSEEFLSSGAILGTVVIERQQGNCHAINRAFSEALARYPHADCLLMIDDDETASPDWLAAMVATRRRFDADIVGGPVERRFPDAAPASVMPHPLFGSPDAETGLVPQIFGTGNCLIARSVFTQMGAAPLDLRFNFLGGGDMDFFTRCRRAGIRFAWAREAIIEENVLPDRIAPKWLRARSMRTGVINFHIDRKHNPGLLGCILLQAKNVVSLGLSPFRFAKLLVRTRSVPAASHPVMMAIGRIAASFGHSPAPYKASD